MSEVFDVPAYASNVHLRVVSFHRGLMIAAFDYLKRDDAGCSTIRRLFDELRDGCVCLVALKMFFFFFAVVTPTRVSENMLSNRSMLRVQKLLLVMLVD